MPYLTFDAPLPPPKTLGSAYNAKDDRPSNIKGTLTVEEKLIKEHSPLPSEPTKPVADEGPKNAYPVVKLDVDTISEATAGRLATSLLGHVLFLKNQVPFPVIQLGRIPGGKVNSRAFKQRTELLSSYDTISSHLDTTFSALSTALAQCASSSAGSSTSSEGKKVAQAHVAILVGPSLSTAKSKVILGIDGLESRIWGAREDSTAQGEGRVDKRNEKEEGGEVGEDDDEEDDDEEDDDEEDEEDDAEEGNSLEESDGAEEPEESEDEEDEEGTDEDKSDDEELTPSQPPPYVSYAEEQKFLQSADRLLSRTLAAADAEGNGITSEMSPTQTHILIRAPRRFNHPAWIPRQNVTAALDASLHDFINNSGLPKCDADAPSPSKQHSKKAKVEGVWITARAGIQHRSVVAGLEQAGKETEDDADEMIWWSWDGKFVGFNDW